ncbi:uncharacterized protein Tco025E_02043 [Trypanosoma conorhini]|uniref:Uncharacterized protein n=1 Tax=Trypanosoma conorhini TaxID=83891 RepID=A0A422Q6S8_9TRYP|nr:uncharacterized protein Tco025E_02043 [Trypanosoma conorhini]RNF25662.1 hypothetical protein Tco025E_02043 [Trypanosoma conorhini]
MNVSVGLRESFFKALAVPEGSSLQQNIIKSADALLVGGGGDELMVIPNGVIEGEAADLFSPLPERREVAVEHLAALWIAAKFWGTSTHRVSMLSLLTDILLEAGLAGKVDEYGVLLQDTPELVNRLYKTEMVLLRRSRFIVPCVSLR